MGVPAVISHSGRKAAASLKRTVSPSHRAAGQRGVRRASMTPRGAITGLRRRVRSPSRPRLRLEIVLILVSYWLYSLVRNAVPEHRRAAMRHARDVWDLEQTLGLAVERSVNHTVNDVTWLVVAMNYYYATLHFVVTISVLVWLFRGHPGRYAAARMVLLVTTGIALVGYYLYPLAPPRLAEHTDFVDTVLAHHTWGSMASGDLANVSNQYAAMPSMHIGWSTWCGIALVVLARRRWVRVLGAVYPVTTLAVIVSTANHFWLDAVGGVLCLSVGSGVVRLVYGRWPHDLPRRVPREPVAGDDPGGPGPRPRIPAPTGEPDARSYGPAPSGAQS